MTISCVLLLAFTCGLVSSRAAGPTYLPPPISVLSEDNSTMAAADNDTLSQRFGEIYFDYRPSTSTLSRRQTDQLISRGIQQLTLDLDHVLATGSMPGGGRGISSPSTERNVVFSPLSIASALALVLLGAGGKTYQELAKVLGLTDASQTLPSDDVIHNEYSRVLAEFQEKPGDTSTVKISSANGIFLQEGFPIRPRYRELSKSLYRSNITNVDFMSRGNEAVAVINDWVSMKTKGRIMGLLSEPPSSDTRLIIASALYFNGEWKYPFPGEVTSQRRFYITGDADAPGEEIEVTMMANSLEIPHYASPTLGCRVVGLPYKGDQVTMYFVLPNKPGISALRELEAKLTPSAIEELVTSTKEESIILLVPRMKLESTISLKDALRTLGLQTLFNPRTANLSLISQGNNFQQAYEPQFIFSRIGDNNNSTANEVSGRSVPTNDQEQMVFRQRRQLENPGLYADDAIHRVEIEITETGTVASAVTLLSVTRDGARKNFRLDRPFIFFIRHEPTGLILFWGSVVRPTPNYPKSAASAKV
ncbi:leukocyte elastase inhibitor [Anabrus simplex]|uniref:leukocyte elastase inhibitor n=1 Tax=Anabrus simplex TaxID=316456 RepID=UPI0035A38C55